MSRFPTLRANEPVKFLKAHGYVEYWQLGSHLILWHPRQSKPVSVPIHTGHDIGRRLALQILKESGFTAGDFLNWR